MWLLFDGKPGHRTQVLGLARRLGWTACEKRLVFKEQSRLRPPNALLGASLGTLDSAASDRLEPPFPDLVIGMGRCTVPVARWIKQRSGGRTRTVLIGRKAVNSPTGIDLGIACAHFGLLPHPRLFELVVPPTQVDATALETARATRPNPLDGMARPRAVLLVGGETAQHAFAPSFAAEMARAVAEASERAGGSLAIVTSRRTGAAAIEAMRAAAPAAHLHAWRAGRSDNPYLSYLAAADVLIVTGESESMLAEAVATARPLAIYPLPVKPESTRQRMARRVRALADGAGPIAGLCGSLLRGGWISPPRDLALMHRLMVERGLARLFTGVLDETAPAVPDDDARLSIQIAALLPEARACP